MAGVAGEARSEASADSKINLQLGVGTRVGEPIRTAAAEYVSIDVASPSWDSARLELLWSLDRERWHSFPSPVYVSSADAQVMATNVRGAAWVQLAIKDRGGSTASEEAEYVLMAFEAV